jgi:hypothetical protein
MSRPLCESDPEKWYAGSNRTEAWTIFDGLEAIITCHSCPLKIGNKCLKDGFADQDSLNYGIRQGTLPFERREALGLRAKHPSYDIQRRIRKVAEKEGFPLIPIVEAKQWTEENGLLKRVQENFAKYRPDLVPA